MTLREILNLWTRKNRTVIISDYNWYDEMFDLVDDINEGNTKIEDISNYVLFAILPHYTQYIESFYIKDEWMLAEVEGFFIGDTAIIIWVDREEKKSR